MRLAYWNVDLSRKGPGLLLQDLQREGALREDLAQVIATIERLKADILVLSGVDYDAQAAALSALNQRLATPYPHVLALRPNHGVPTGLDLDGNGRRGEARDAHSFGRFPGEGGMAILSRLAFEPSAARDFSQLLWRDFHEAQASVHAQVVDLPSEFAAVLRLSSAGHYQSAVTLPAGGLLHLLSWHGVPPAFDAANGPQLNLWRNHDETDFWRDYLAKSHAPKQGFVLIGQANTDPEKGRGTKAAIRALVSHPQLQDVLPGDTVDYGGELGALRVAYILPSRDLAVVAAGHASVAGPSRHHPIWIEIDMR